MGSKSEVLGYRPAEVVGDIVDEPSVELVTSTLRVGGGPLHPTVGVVDLLGLGCLASSGCIEGDRVGGILLDIP